MFSQNNMPVHLLFRRNCLHVVHIQFNYRYWLITGMVAVFVNQQFVSVGFFSKHNLLLVCISVLLYMKNKCRTRETNNK